MTLSQYIDTVLYYLAITVPISAGLTIAIVGVFTMIDRRIGR